MFEGMDVDRRTLLQGTAAAALPAFVTGMADLAAAAEEPASTRTPPEARSIEAGLSLFVTKWNAVGPVITNTQQFGTYLQGRTYNLYVADDDRVFTVELGPEGGAAVEPGASPFAHVSLTVDRDDWIDILYGEYSGLAPAIQGRAFLPRSEVNTGAILAIVISVLAHVPVSLAHELGQDAKTLRGALERQGETDCGSAVGDQQVETAAVRLERLATGRENRAPPATAELADRVAALTYDDLPPAVVDVVKDQLKSILGVCYAATTMEPVATFLDAMETIATGTDATVIAGGRTYSAAPAEAALVNSYLGQMLEWEDWTFMAHTGATIVPTALAVAEAAGASGRELVTAIAVGNEIAGRTGTFLTDPTHLGQALPVHQTQLPFVAGKLLGLDATQLQDASGIAGTQPQVPAIATWPAGVKGLIGGEPAGTSVRAAQLAAAGVTGKRDHLENVGGYWFQVSDILDPRYIAAAYDGLGEAWLLTEEFFNKRYPCDGFTQTAVHATLEVREQLLADGIDPAAEPEAIDRIEVGMNSAKAATGTLFSADEYDNAVGRVRDDDRPDWTYTALLFDGAYPLAAALLDGELTHRQYQPATVADDRIELLYDRIEETTDVSVGTFGAEVTVVADGDDYASRLTTGLGDREYGAFVGCMADVNEGFSAEDKFHLAAEDVLPPRRRERLLSTVDDIESVGNVRRLAQRL